MNAHSKRDGTPEPDELPRSSDHVESLARGLSVIQAFETADQGLSLAEIARKVDLSRATVRRIVLTLQSLGLVAADRKRFTLTPDVLRLAQAYLTSDGQSRVLQSACEEVTANTGHACSAAVLKDRDVVFVARARAPGILTIDLEPGYRLPAHCTAVGRVILSGLQSDALDRILGDGPLVARTDRTATNPDHVKAAIVTAGVQGYCLVDGEAEEGFRSLAVPVRRHDERILGALNIGAPAERISLGRMIDDLRPVLIAAAGRAGRLIV
ncbi:MAG: IclR family transcriptional regulator C-terminal domain-containing protein [Pseudomonadota bacterium]